MSPVTAGMDDKEGSARFVPFEPQPAIPAPLREPSSPRHEEISKKQTALSGKPTASELDKTKSTPRPASTGRTTSLSGKTPVAQGRAEGEETTPDEAEELRLLESAHRFLEVLDLQPPPLVEGIADGSELLDVVVQAARKPQCCVLVADAPGDQQRWFFFYQADTLTDAYRLPVDVKYSLPLLLAGQGLLPQASARQIWEAATERNIPEETAIHELGLMDSSLLQNANRAKVKLLLAELGTAGSLTYRLFALDPPPPLLGLRSSPPPKGFHPLYRQLGALSWDEMTKIQEPHLSSYPTLSIRSDILCQDLGLDGKLEHFVATCLGGEHSLRALTRISNLTRAQTFAAVFALKELGLLSFLPKPSQHATRAKREEVITEHYRNLRQADDFEILHLHWMATQAEIDRALSHLEEEYSPQRCEDLEPSTQEKARELLARVKAAHQNLKTVELRRRYRATILEDFEIEKAIDLIIGQVTMAVFRKDIPLVNHLLDQIEELKPNIYPAIRDRVKTQLGELLTR
ncbi:MAG: hypothetical protein JW797_11305 [Bradymonadales bacterium]|nr:hypothetical protein [Bradymonadales bacterium]